MDSFDELAQAVHEAAKQLTSLKKEKAQLRSEVATLRVQLKNFQELKLENDRYRREHEQIRSKLTRLNKRIETVLSPSLRVSDVAS